MKAVSCVIILLCAIFEVNRCQQFDESAWMDNAGRDKYFEYSEPAYVDTIYSDKIDEVESFQVDERQFKFRVSRLRLHSQLITSKTFFISS